jgi:hypothetical protein
MHNRAGVKGEQMKPVTSVKVAMQTGNRHATWLNGQQHPSVCNGDRHVSTL